MLPTGSSDRADGWPPAHSTAGGRANRREAMALDMLQNLLGGGQQRQDYQDFVNRYDQGHPSEGYSNQEVANRYQQVAPQLPPNVYQESAEQSFARLTPEERAEFARWLQTRAQQQHVDVPGLNQ